MRGVIRKHGKSHLPGGSDPIEIEAGGPAPWCRLNMSEDQTVDTFPDSPAIVFDPEVSINDYPGTFTILADADPVQVELLEDGIYHAVIYIQVTENPTNGYELCFTGGQMDTSENWNGYVDPRGSVYRYAEYTFRRGDSTQWVYAFVRTISGNGTWVIEWDSTFLEIHKLADAVS